MGIAINGKIPAGFAINGKKVGGMALNGQVIWKASSLPPVGTALNDCTWAQISAIANAGLAPDYFVVGDRKAVHVQGMVGTVALNATYYVYILGFNHNGATNCIDFGTFKTALTGGKDIGIYGRGMNSAGTNNGGWKNCVMRKTFLGSTNTENGDATATTATSPTTDTLMGALPSDLRAVMKPMTIWSDNVGGGGNTASKVTTTVDYLPLLAEFEIFGARKYANSAEQTHQKQYQYFKSDNLKVKYAHNEQGTLKGWWVRSTMGKQEYGFCYVNKSGIADNDFASMAWSVAPIFRV